MCLSYITVSRIRSQNCPDAPSPPISRLKRIYHSGLSTLCHNSQRCKNLQCPSTHNSFTRFTNISLLSQTARREFKKAG